jgi:hypothetical protein
VPNVPLTESRDRLPWKPSASVPSLRMSENFVAPVVASTW